MRTLVAEPGHFSHHVRSAFNWYLALVSGGVAGLAYGVIGLIAKLVTPWSSGSTERGR